MASSIQKTGGGTTKSFVNTPQATDDIFSSAATGITEDSAGVYHLDVMGNDLGGNAKSLWSLDNGVNNTGAMSGYVAGDLLTQDTARSQAGSSDTSLNGAKIWITADGKVGYDASTLSASFRTQLQALNDGQSLSDTFTYAIRLANGTLSWATASIELKGSNDAAVIAGVTSGAVTEAGGVDNGVAGTPVATGVLTAADVDNAANTFQPVTAATSSAGGYGTYTLTTGGVWTYTLDNANSAVQALNAGQQLTDTFTVRTIDGTARQVTVTIDGTNDAAILSSAVVELTETDSAADLSTGGTLTVSDVDSAATFVAQAGTAGSYGTFAIDAAGAWTYAATSAQDAFVAGQTYSDSFAVTSADGTATSVTINIVGTNDAAILSSAVVNLTEADSATDISTSGTLAISDVDSAATFVAQAGTAGSYGTFAIDAAGAWTYTATSAQDAFVAGQTYTDNFAVTSADGTATSVAINILGTNDAAVILGDVTGAVVEAGSDTNGGTPVATGTLTASDADNASNSFQAVVAATAGDNGYGSYTMAADGSWAYTLDNDNAAVEALDAGDTLTDFFTVLTVDGTAQQVAVTINGAADGPVNQAPVAVDDVVESVAGGGDAAIITFDDGYSIDYDYMTGFYRVTTGDGFRFTDKGTGSYQQGNYVWGPYVTSWYGADYSNALYSYGYEGGYYEYIGTETVVMPIEMTRVDGEEFALTSANITSYNYGGNPAAAFLATVTGYLDGQQVAQQSFNVPDANYYSQIHNNVVTFTDPGFGSVDMVEYALTAENNGYAYYDYYYGYYYYSYSYAYQWIDNIQTGAASSGPMEGRVLAGIAVLANDTDDGPQGDLSIAQFSATSALGAAVTLNPDGTLNYDPTAVAAINALGAGESLVDSFTYVAQDAFGAVSNTATVTLDVQGVNDTPVAAAIAGAANEDGSAIVLSAAYTDADPNDSHTFTLNTSGTLGTVTDLGSGNFDYDASTSAVFNQLAQGATATDSFSYTVTDNHGGHSTATATVTVTGQNDAPVAQDDRLNPVALLTFENGTFSQSQYYDYGTGFYRSSVTTNDGFHFADNGAGNYQQGDSVYGPYTTSSWGADYSNALYSYGYDSNYDLLGHVMPIVMTRVDGESFQLEQANITGYAYYASYYGGGVLRETVTGYLDGVQGATLTFDVPNIAISSNRNNSVDLSGLGEVDRVEFALLDIGNYNYDYNNQWLDNIEVAQSLTNEDTSVQIASATLLANDTDVDNGHVLHVGSVSATSALGAALTIDGNGMITYDPTVSSILGALGENEFANDSFVYTAVDEHGASSQATASLRIAGAYDAPTAQNHAPTVTGALNGGTLYVWAGADVPDGDGGGPQFNLNPDALPAVVDALDNATDADHDPLSVESFTVVAGNKIGLWADISWWDVNSDQAISFDADANTFALDPNAYALQGLRTGESATVTVAYNVSDGQAATPDSVSWTLVGTNDASLVGLLIA